MKMILNKRTILDMLENSHVKNETITKIKDIMEKNMNILLIRPLNLTSFELFGGTSYGYIFNHAKNIETSLELSGLLEDIITAGDIDTSNVFFCIGQLHKNYSTMLINNVYENILSDHDSIVNNFMSNRTVIKYLEFPETIYTSKANILDYTMSLFNHGLCLIDLTKNRLIFFYKNLGKLNTIQDNSNAYGDILYGEYEYSIKAFKIINNYLVELTMDNADESFDRYLIFKQEVM